MAQVASSSHAAYLGSGVVPLIFVEVIPLRYTQQSLKPTQDATLSAPRAKLILRQRTMCSNVTRNISIRMVWDDARTKSIPVAETEASTSRLMSGSLVSLALAQDSPAPCWAHLQNYQKSVPVIYLPSDHPNHLDPCPCWVLGYAKRNFVTAEQPHEAFVSDATLVRILPVEAATLWSETPPRYPVVMRLPIESTELWKSRLTGESSRKPLSPEMLDEVLHNHDAGTVKALTLRMSLLLAQSVSIGTTADALLLKRKRQSRGEVIRGALNSYRRAKHPESEIPFTAPFTESCLSNKKSSTVPLLLQEGALIVHSPDHGSGKTLLVRAIAQQRLNCDTVHTVQPGALFAKYGAHADAALESLLHAIVVSAACRQQSVCIILDHMDAMLPPNLSGRTCSGDAAVPVLNAIGEKS